MWATVEGAGSSPFFLTNAKAQRDAVRRAEEHLAFALEHAQQAVPCPHCGWYQAAMVKTLLAPRLHWMWLLAWTAGVGGSGLVVMFWGVLSNSFRRSHFLERPYLIGIEVGFVLLWMGGLLLRRRLVARYDPNRGWFPGRKQAPPCPGENTGEEPADALLRLGNETEEDQR